MSTSTLPLPAELQALLESQARLQQAQRDHEDLLQRLSSLLDARRVGHSRMDLAVDLGMGYTIQGVVDDTRSIILASGVQDLWVQLGIEQAVPFVQKRLNMVNKRAEALEPTITKLRQDYALVARTLRQALAPPANEDDPNDNGVSSSSEFTVRHVQRSVAPQST